MMDSGFTSYQGCIIVDLATTDFKLKNYSFLFLEQIQHLAATNVVLSMKQQNIITSTDITNLQTLVQAIQLAGMNVVVCDIHPECAAIVAHFIDGFNFPTSLNVERAMYAFES